jgi:Lon protease-like protein
VSSLLPIFPLDLVLLPGSPLPLHIFEPRYKEMIAECLEQKKPFGVVRASSDGVAEIGCTAEIVSVTKKYDDGRMDILTRGVERFEVIELNQDRSFLQARGRRKLDGISCRLEAVTSRHRTAQSSGRN